MKYGDNPSENNSELMLAFPTPIKIYKYKSSIEKELKYVEGLEWVSHQSFGGKFTSEDSYLTKHESLKSITSFFEECIYDYCETAICTDQKLIITQLWGNRDPKGAMHHEHTHSNSIISGVFYLRQNSEQPPIQIVKPIKSGILLTLKEQISWHAANRLMLPCTSGELIIFPSDLSHSVPTNNGDEDRISLSFNTFSIDVLGSKDSLTHLDIKTLVRENI